MIPIKQIRSGECRDPYAKIGSGDSHHPNKQIGLGAIVGQFPDKKRPLGTFGKGTHP